MYYSTKKIKTILLNFHKNRGYKIFESFPLVSIDQTVMFVNATITPFKSWFTDDSIRPRNYALVQRCLRMGGASKPDFIGINPYYFTFFEMFGSGTFHTTHNEAVSYLLELLAAFGIERKQLYFTIPASKEFRAALKKIGIKTTRIFQLTENDYFWQEWKFGVPGPVGHGLTVIFPRSSEKIESIKQLTSNQNQFMELLNLIHVHSQSLPDGGLVPIANPGFDLGVGIERLAAVLQGCDAYHIDTVLPIIQAVKDFLSEQKGEADDNVARVCADHFRAIYVLLAEKITPSNKGHGYVLRKLMRRFIETAWTSIGNTAPIRGLVERLSHTLESHGYVTGIDRFADVADRISEEEAALLSIFKRAEKIIRQHPDSPPQKLYDTYGISGTLLALINPAKTTPQERR